jgi:hypothetical protein
MKNSSKKHIPKIIQILLKTKRLICLFISLFFLTTISNACAMNLNFLNKNKLPTTPYALPIDISKKGNKAQIDLRIKTDKERARLEPKIIAFELRFFWYDPRDDKNSKYYEGFWRRNFKNVGRFKKYFKYSDEEKNEIWKDHHRVLNLMEHKELISSGTGSTYKSKWIHHKGVSLPNIRLTIINLDDPDKKIIYDEVLEVKKHWQIAGYFYKYLTHIDLSPGSYKIIAEVQSDALDFEGTEVKIIIGSYRAKV